MKLHFITFALLIPFAATFSANCEFKDENWDYFGPAYFCNLKGITSETPNTMVDDVHGSHLSEKTNNDVNSIEIDYSPDCVYFPEGFDSFFSNITGLSVINSGLETITKDDLRPFPNLTGLWVYANKLTTVEPNLFIFNAQVTFIDFGNNYITSISGDLFDYLENLEVAKFNQNICIKTDATNLEALTALKKKIFQNCQNGLPMVKSRLSEDGSQCKNNQMLIDDISLLKAMFLKQQKEIDNLTTKFDERTTSSQ